MCQHVYTEKVLERFKMQEANPVEHLVTIVVVEQRIQLGAMCHTVTLWAASCTNDGNTSRNSICRVVSSMSNGSTN